jgi:lipoprotein-anchoring transpeptidase ErfK/SrfK
MATSVLQPKGVHYDIDSGGRGPHWRWVFVFLLLVAAGGLIWRFWPQLSQLHFWPARAQAPVATVAMSKMAAPVAAPAMASKPNSHPAVVGARAGAARPAAAATAPAVNSDARRQVEEAEVACRADDFVSARRRYLALLEHLDRGMERTFAENRLGEINTMLAMTPRPMPEKTEVTVAPGDAVDRIARKTGNTRELILRANNISRAERLLIGQRLLVLDHPVFAITVNCATNEMRLMLNNTFFKRYAVGTGRPEETPRGAFVIHGKQESPSWWRGNKELPYGHPENVIGTRWMTLQSVGDTTRARGYGIHGMSESTGKETAALIATSGGIRMRNADIEELSILVPDGTPVQVVN